MLDPMHHGVDVRFARRLLVAVLAAALAASTALAAVAVAAG